MAEFYFESLSYVNLGFLRFSESRKQQIFATNYTNLTDSFDIFASFAKFAANSVSKSNFDQLLR